MTKICIIFRRIVTEFIWKDEYNPLNKISTFYKNKPTKN